MFFFSFKAGRIALGFEWNAASSGCVVWPFGLTDICFRNGHIDLNGRRGGGELGGVEQVCV